MRDLPIGWATSKLGDVIELKYGKALPDRERSGAGHPVYGSNGIVGYHATALTKGKTIIIGRKGSVGEVHFSMVPCSPIDTTYYLEQLPFGNPQYWYYQLKQLDLRTLNKSTAIPGFNRSDAYSLDIDLAPRAEQKRIADKLDTVLARVDTCRERLDRVAVFIERFRKSVLAAATSGKLSEDWRQTRYPNSDDESVEINEKYKFPASWQQILMQQLASLITSGSRGWADFYSRSGATFIRAQNINKDKLDLTDVAFVNLPTIAEGKRSIVECDDLLITITGANVGKSARIDLRLPEAYVSQHVALIKLHDKVNAKFLEIFCWAENAGRGQLNEFAYGGGKPGLNLQNIKNLVVGLPSPQEQHEIVRRVETLFAFADRLEARLATARTAADRLTPALLAKAFRGELVPQDPNDEPASVLLQRLAAARSEVGGKSKRTKKSSSQSCV